MAWSDPTRPNGKEDGHPQRTAVCDTCALRTSTCLIHNYKAQLFVLAKNPSSTVRPPFRSRGGAGRRCALQGRPNTGDQLSCPKVDH